jgi:methylmalonyl-CoA mutase
MDHNEQKKLFEEFPPVSTSAWEEIILKDLKGADYHKKLIWKTDEGFDVKPYYRAGDLQGLEYLNTLPDQAPYVRGVRKENNDWIVRQDFYTSDPEENNVLALDAVAKGAGAVGLQTREVTTHKQMSRLLAGIDFAKTGINFISSQSYRVTLELLLNEMSNRGDAGNDLRGSLNFDPISYLLLNGDFYANWNNNLDEAASLLKTIRKRVPLFKAITVNGHYFQNAGSTLVQELAFSLASANEYLAGLTDKGFSVDEVAPYIQLSMGIGSNYFMEIAKLRAARLLWTMMVKQYQPQHEDSLKVFIHATTAMWNKSIYDPYVNMLRTTTEGMSAALGNADSLTIQPFDTAFRDPDEISQRIARNQQLVLKEESYLNKIIDPASGSYYIENLTHAIAHHAWNLFREVESLGGMIECCKSGFIQDKVESSCRQKEMDIAQRKTVILGTNQYPNIHETMLDNIGHADGAEVVLPAAYKKLTPFRGATAFEEVRLATERYVKKGNKRPLVFLFTMGNLAMLRARAGFTANFFGCAGYDILDNPGFATTDEGVEAVLLSGAEIVVICSSDEEYVAIVPEIAAKLKKASSNLHIVVAGYPKENIDEFRAAGVSDFIHVRSNLLETLRNFQNNLEIM